MNELEQKHADEKAFTLLASLIRTARDGYEYKSLLKEFKQAIRQSPKVKEYVKELTKEVKDD